MGRPLRDDEADATFHITLRVNWQHWLLKSDRAVDVFLGLLRRALEKFGLDLIAYCMMSNHVHLVLRSPPRARFLRLTSRRTKCRHRRPYPQGHPKASVISQAMK